MKNILLLLCIISNFIAGNFYSQSTSEYCNIATPVNPGVNTFPSPVNTSAEIGPDYNCLYTQPNPAWFFLKIDTSGSIIIDITQVTTSGTGVDVDYICWGPFTDPSTPCTAQLDSAHIVSCSYSTAFQETATFPTTVTGEYYLMMITNYSNQPGTVTFSVNPSSTGSLDPSTSCTTHAYYNTPLCLNNTLHLLSTNHLGAGNYSWTGPNGFISSMQNPIIPGASASDNGYYYVNYIRDSTCNETDSILISLDTCGMLGGTVYSDANSNCAIDTADNGIGNVKIKLYQNNMLTAQAWTDVNGNYNFNMPPGNYSIEAVPSPGHFFTCSSSLPHATTINATSFTTENFAADCNAFDYAASYINAAGIAFFPGTTKQMFLYTSFNGPQCSNGPVAGQVTVVLDTLVSYASNYPGCSIPDTIINSPSGDTLTWNISDISALYYYGFNSFGFYYTTSTQATIGDSVHIKLIVNATGDVDNSNNIFSRDFEVGNSYDPNIKEVLPEGIGPDGYIPAATPELDYTIHFQNTGTASAHNIYILDTLHPNLDISTIKIITSSHLQSTSLLAGNVLKFNFSNIMLPDSNSNEPESHGFVKYTVAPLPGLIPGNKITNTAYIYFDYNTPVVTNTTVNTIELVTGISFIEENGIKIFPNPAGNSVTVKFDEPGESKFVQLRILNINGQVVHSENYKSVSGKFSSNIDLNNYAAGIYFVQLSTDTRVVNAKLIKQ